MRSTAPRGVAVSPDGKNVYVASFNSNAVARLNRNTTTGAITQPAGTAGCISETGSGPCADGHGLYGRGSVAVSADGKSVYVASSAQRRRGAPQPQHDHRGAHPARRDRRLHQRGRVGAVRRRPWARRPVRGGGEPGRKERLRRLAPTATPWRASTATRPPGRSPSPLDRRLHQRGRDGALRRRARARWPERGGGRARTGRASTSPRSTAAPWRDSTGRPKRGASCPRGRELDRIRRCVAAGRVGEETSPGRPSWTMGAAGFERATSRVERRS